MEGPTAVGSRDSMRFATDLMGVGLEGADDGEVPGRMKMMTIAKVSDYRGGGSSPKDFWVSN